jgi:hypothetical protein
MVKLGAAQTDTVPSSSSPLAAYISSHQHLHPPLQQLHKKGGCAQLTDGLYEHRSVPSVRASSPGVPRAWSMQLSLGLVEGIRISNSISNGTDLHKEDFAYGNVAPLPRVALRSLRLWTAILAPIIRTPSSRRPARAWPMR